MLGFDARFAAVFFAAMILPNQSFRTLGIVTNNGAGGAIRDRAAGGIFRRVATTLGDRARTDYVGYAASKPRGLKTAATGHCDELDRDLTASVTTS